MPILPRKPSVCIPLAGTPALPDPPFWLDGPGRILSSMIHAGSEHYDIAMEMGLES